MDPIAEIDLVAEARAAEDEVLAEKRAKVRSAVRGIVGDLANWKEDRIKKQKELEQLNGKIAGAEDKYKKLATGDWSVLNDNMLKNQPSSEK